LKKLLQEASIPPWLRERMPLIYLGGELACVPDLWVAESFQAAAHEPAWNIHWSLPARLSAQYAAPRERAAAPRR
jgi:tRNA(Ile)-lysidine synthase